MVAACKGYAATTGLGNGVARVATKISLLTELIKFPTSKRKRKMGQLCEVSFQFSPNQELALKLHHLMRFQPSFQLRVSLHELPEFDLQEYP